MPEGFAARISKQVRKDTSYHLVYPPGVELQLGDIVEQQAGVWIPVGNLAEDLGITIQPHADATAGDWEPSSERGVIWETKLAGEPAPAFKYLTDAESGVKLTLSGEAAFVLSLAGERLRRIRSIDTFWDAVREKRGFWTWDLSRRIVTRIVTAESATFLASGSQEATFELEASAEVSLGMFQVASLAAGFTLKSTMSAKDRFVSKASVTPLFGAHRVKFFGGLGVAEVGGATIDQSELEEGDGDDDAGA